MKTLDGGRIGIASQALGIAQGALDETVKYTMERKQFGKSISQFQNTQFQMADLKTKVEASRLLVRVRQLSRRTARSLIRPMRRWPSSSLQRQPWR